MEEELNIYSSHGTDETEALAKALEECRQRHKKGKEKKKKRPTRAHYAATIIDELRDLLAEYTEPEE